MSTMRQTCAAGAAVIGAAAAGGLVIAAAGTPGLRLRGSVSQLGATGERFAATYQVAVLGIALAVGLLAISIEPISLLASGALVATAGLGTVSAVVPCSPGCPIPPDPTATTGDIVHVVASSAAFVFVACAMLLLARSGVESVARLCRYALVLVIALGTPVGVALVLTGEGIVNGVTERAMMAVALFWLVRVSMMAARLSRAEPVGEPRYDSPAD